MVVLPLFDVIVAAVETVQTRGSCVNCFIFIHFVIIRFGSSGSMTKIGIRGAAFVARSLLSQWPYGLWLVFFLWLVCLWFWFLCDTFICGGLWGCWECFVACLLSLACLSVVLVSV
eukprot:108818_1